MRLIIALPVVHEGYLKPLIRLSNNYAIKLKGIPK